MQQAQTAQAVTEFMAAFLKKSADTIRPEKELTALVKESFVLIQMVVEMQEALKVRLVQDDLAKVKTVGQLIEAIAKKKGA